MFVFWRVGYPGWRIASKIGLPIKLIVDVYFDTEAQVYFATSDDIGLAVESESLDDLVKEIHAAIPVLMEIAHISGEKPKMNICLHDDLVAA